MKAAVAQSSTAASHSCLPITLSFLLNTPHFSFASNTCHNSITDCIKNLDEELRCTRNAVVHCVLGCDAGGVVHAAVRRVRDLGRECLA